MDDSNVEAILSALGEPLKWEKDTSGHVNTAFLEDGTFYCVGKSTNRWHIHFFSLSDGEQELTSSLSLAATKAACERHRATGKWE